MSWTYTANIALGTQQTGLSLKAAVMDVFGAFVAKDLTAGFVEQGAGRYTWNYTAMPDGVRGSVGFYTGAIGAGTTYPAGMPLAQDGLDGVEEFQANAAANGVVPIAITTTPGNVGASTAFSVLAGYDWDQSLTLNGTDSTAWTKFVLTIKRKVEQPDGAALLAVRVTNPAAVGDGLIVFKGNVAGAPDASLGAITVTGITTNTSVSWAIAAAGMDLPAGSFKWELTRWTGAVKAAIAGGNLTIGMGVRESPTAP